MLFISCAHYYPPMVARLKVDKNRALPIARACENGFFVCKANAVGSYRGEINLGHSIIVGPNGVVIAEAGETQEELLTFDIDEKSLIGGGDRPNPDKAQLKRSHAEAQRTKKLKKLSRVGKHRTLTPVSFLALPGLQIPPRPD